MNLLQDLLSIGSQLKGILEPVEQFVGKLAHILTTATQKNKHCRCQKEASQSQRLNAELTLKAASFYTMVP